LSLIDEALKRARQEAAQQDAARRGPSPSWTPVPLAPFRERRSPLPAIAGIALALALVLTLSFWWTRRAPSPLPARVAAAPAPVPVVAPPPRAQRAPAERPPRERLPERAAPGERSGRSGRSVAAAPEPPRPRRVEPQREPSPAEEPVRREAAAPRLADQPARAVEPRPTPPPLAKEPRPAAPEDGRSYVREAPLPSGRKLELRGIAFSDTQPVVLINGKVLSPGEGVEGYTVVSIQPQRVELRGATGTVFLTLQ
jgi:flagellar protein FliO/FliZ